MLIGFAVFHAPHVEPGGGVGVAGFVFEFSDGGHDYEIALGDDGDDLGLPFVGLGDGALGHVGEELHDRVQAGRDAGVVLDVLLREVLGGLIPMARLEEVSDDVEDGLLVSVELGVGAGEQGFGVLGADDGGMLGGGGGRHQETDQGKGGAEHASILDFGLLIVGSLMGQGAIGRSPKYLVLTYSHRSRTFIF